VPAYVDQTPLVQAHVRGDHRAKPDLLCDICKEIEAEVDVIYRAPSAPINADGEVVP
jgi:hypothetical protein